MGINGQKCGGGAGGLRSLALGLRRHWRRGQVLIPSILVVPSLMLFIYLIFETTKLSREKIRQQFAVDSAAFIQMGDYTNILNRTAYVNGAFPYRIFKEAYSCPRTDEGGVDVIGKTDGSGTECPYDLLYESGAVPKYEKDQPGLPIVPLDDVNQWTIAFNPVTRNSMNKNPAEPEEELMLFTYTQGVRAMLMWGESIGMYKFYTQVYSLLGTVEESQVEVFKRLTEQFNFFRKSYYLNANTKECSNDPGTCANDGVGRFQKFLPVMHYIQSISFHGKVPLSNDPAYKIYDVGKTPAPQDMKNCPGCNPKGLFQLATFGGRDMEAVGKGYEVYQGWDVPGNYFNVDFKSKVGCQGVADGKACVHARITSQCPNLFGSWSNSSPNNCVWPNPTPKYQTRLYP